MVPSAVLLPDHASEQSGERLTGAEPSRAVNLLDRDLLGVGLDARRIYSLGVITAELVADRE